MTCTTYTSQTLRFFTKVEEYLEIAIRTAFAEIDYEGECFDLDMLDQIARSVVHHLGVGADVMADVELSAAESLYTFESCEITQKNVESIMESLKMGLMQPMLSYQVPLA
jgi:hypothetical protein